MSHEKAHKEEARILYALEKSHPEAGAFRALSTREVWAAGTLSEKEKHLVAVAIAQITRCAFCIEHHSLLARDTGATRDEGIAVSYVSAVLEAFGQATVLLEAGQLHAVDESAVADKAIATARQTFANRVFATDTLTPAFRWTVAAAVAYAQSHESNRRRFHDAARAAGQADSALDEAYAIAVVLRAGAVYAHTLHVASVFDSSAG